MIDLKTKDYLKKCQISYIPSNIFKYNTLITDYTSIPSIFRNCKTKEISNNIKHSNKRITCDRCGAKRYKYSICEYCGM